MKYVWPTIAVLIFLAYSLPAETGTTPLPPLYAVIQRALARAAMEDENDREFNRSYHYERIRLTEYRNGKGELKKHEEKRTPEGANKTNSVPATAPAPVEKDDAPVSETHSNIKGKAFAVKDYSLSNLVSRFQFTLVGRETVNGRHAGAGFSAGSKDLPVNSYKDHFINKAAGRVWVDEADYAIAKADLHLTQQVNVLGGRSARSGNSPTHSSATGRRKVSGSHATWTGIWRDAKSSSIASWIITSRKFTNKKFRPWRVDAGGAGG